MILRDVAAACMARTGIFSLSNIVSKTGLDRVKVRRAMEKLEREGHVTRATEAERPLPGFSRGRPTKEPRYRTRASLKGRLAAMGDVRQPDAAWDRIWRAIRQLRRFTRKDLVVTADATLSNVKYLTLKLRAAGYIRQTGRNTWALVKDPGPRRPSVKKGES